MLVDAVEKVCQTGATASVVVSTAGAPVSQGFFAWNLFAIKPRRLANLFHHFLFDKKMVCPSRHERQGS